MEGFGAAMGGAIYSKSEANAASESIRLTP